MKSRFIFGALLAGSLALGQRPAVAEDLDLFVQPAGAGGVPNVLIILDNTANWSRSVSGQAIYINERAALVSTLGNLPVNADGTARFRVGVEMFTETGGGNTGNDGGYMRAAIRNMTTANKTLYNAMLTSIDLNGDKSNGGKAGLAMAEAWRYFAGQAPYAGNYKNKTDYRGNVFGALQSRAVYSLAGNALNSKAGSPYNTPVIAGNCGRHYIIYISNGAAQDNNADTVTGTTMLNTAATAEGVSGATTGIPISPSGSQANMSDEWARFMKNSSLGVVTYTVDVDKIATGQGPGWTALLKSMAGVSNGRYFDVTSGSGGASIADALGRIFSEIQAVNSVFASVSLPVSVNTQSTFLNQVYVGMFRPDANALPRWAGNLKQYKLGIVGSQLRTLDAADQNAINSLTGFITECARSFWTPTTVDTYWAFRPQGGCLAVLKSGISNYPDGNVVEKGGQAYKLRSATARTLKTCSAVFASCTATTDFNLANASITQALLGPTVTSTERDQLINWQRGLDVDDENLDGVTTTVMRPSVHGSVVHSRPVAINLGSAVSPQVVVFYGGNDGVLRAVNGNRATAIGRVAAGAEMWSFIAPEFFANIKRLRDNSPAISYTGAISPPVRATIPHGFDGPITAFKDLTRTWIYAGARRGGRFVYSFDVTDITTSPTTTPLKWKRGCPNQGDNTNCSSGFNGIGQTWSAAQNMKTNGYTSAGVAAPMLIMGGGYSSCEDTDPHTCTAASKGHYIYVMNADTGSLLRTFTTDRPVVADVFVVPDTTTGLAQYAYAVDMGGNVYRISGATANVTFGATAPASWTITKIASLGCDTASAVSPSVACPMNRKFMFAPDVVLKDGIFHLLLGSGDREKPLQAFALSYAVQNKFFMIKDLPSDTNWLSSERANCGSAILCLDSLVPIDVGAADPDPADLATMKGWALDLRDHEQGVTSAITVFGVTTFSTHTPTVPIVGACTSNLGTARVYNVRFANAAAANGTNNRDEPISGGGLPPSPVAGMVELDDGSIVPFLIGGVGASPLESSLPTPSASGTQAKSLTYWFIDK